MDLCSIAKTSLKLKEIATYVFSRSHKICDFDSMALEKDAVELVLNTFGSTILELRINLSPSPYTYYGEEIVESIVHNCTEMTSLTMKSYDIPDTQDAITKVRCMFGKLCSLHIFDIAIEGYESMNFNDCVTPNGNVLNLFGDCHSLVELKADDCFVLERSIFDATFPKLEYMYYRDHSEHLLKGIRSFVLRHNGHLKKLILGDNMDDTLGVIDIISANCKELNHFEFETHSSEDNHFNDGTVLRQLGTLQQLSTLKIDWYAQNVNELLMELQRSTSLRELQLGSTLGTPDLISTIGQIKSLRILKLYKTDHLQNLNALQNLTRLVELYIENHNLRVGELDFDLPNVVQRLTNLKKLKLDLSGYPPYSDYRISKNIYVRLVHIVGNRQIVQNRYLELDCPAENGVEHLLCPTTVHFCKINDD